MTRQEKLEAYCAYLPHGLEWYCLDQDSREFENIHLQKIDVVNGVLEIGGMDIDIEDMPYPSGLTIKLILRPMSDLAGKRTGKEVMSDLNCALANVHEIWELADGRKKLEDVTESTMLVMKRNKIDYTRMIDSGEAISIHDVKR